MTKEEALRILDTIPTKGEVVDALEMAIEALEQKVDISTNTPTENDYIRRQAAIDALAELQGKASTKAELKGISKVWKRIKKLPSAQQWIPVTERLPIPNERIGNVRKYYLIQNEYGDMMVACYSGEWEQIYRHEYCLDKVVAWMPLPKPYETQESEDKE